MRRAKRLLVWARQTGISAAGWLALAAAGGVAAVAGVGLVGVSQDVISHDGLFRSDPSHLNWFVAHRPPMIVDVAKLATDLGSVGVLAVVATAAAALLWWRGARLVVALAPLGALAVAGVVVAAGKQIMHRQRPPVALRLVTETEPSFPSGHAADSTAVLLTIAIVVAVVLFRRPLLRIGTVALGFAVPALIGLSRLVLGVHWPTDVLAGWGVGTLAALTVSVTCLLVARRSPVVPAEHQARWRRSLARLGRLLGARRPDRVVRSAAI